MSEVLTKIVVDCSTGITSEVPLTSEELVQREADAVQAEADRVAQEAEEAQKAAEKAELLAKLGISADEAKLLLA
jgi:hypothetical protein